QRRLEGGAPGVAGRKPMASREGRWVMVYNGELYNDSELRVELSRLGLEPDSPSDTATMCQVLSAWGPQGLRRCRGMFALVAHDTVEQRIVLVRDPLGIKPLCYAWAQPADGRGPELVAASEVTALFEHPHLSPRVDPLGLAAYLCTIRLSTEGRTLFDGVSVLPPGRVLAFDLGDKGLACESWDLPLEGDDGADLCALVEESVAQHLRSDVPVCVMLSGGLDSTIIAATTRKHRLRLPTFGAGGDGDGPSSDAVFAAGLAVQWDMPHHAIRMTQERFTAGVRALISRTGQPVSTPNETAIHALGCAIRASGCRVALTGEGADELFGGYHAPLQQAVQYIDAGGDDPGVAFLVQSAWVAPQLLPRVLCPRLARIAEFGGWLVEAYRKAYEDEAARPGPVLLPRDEALRAHMRLVRRTNLVGLLQRVDSALSQSGVEGRTPLADRVVAAYADALPMAQKFDPSLPAHEGTKIALRRAFAGDVPPEIMSRPKASFPLPFQGWLGPLFNEVGDHPLIGEFFDRGTWDTVAADPRTNWQLAWPMLNVALWARRWFG
ncbi:MAG: asparagine synthetase B family protein, partial [Phycisphaerales bacterium JB060]